MKNRGFTRQNFNTKISGGFTLIELLVVIAVIGILASVILASLNSARGKAKDAKKVSELRSLSTALQMYYDQYATVPPNNNPCCWVPIDATLFAPIVSGGFISNVPPPAASADAYYYYDYGTYVMLAVYVSDKYGPGSRGWHCSDAAAGVPGSKYYCLEFDK
ncbi:MAG TPA: type II secretion system protein [Candidatus Paceibacterota bacterium]